MNALFVSLSVARAGYYRAVLPAMWGGWDWAAIAGEPPGLQLISSWVKGSTLEPSLAEYDVVVLEQVRGRRWTELIRKLRRHGVKVLYEIDDYVHGIRKAADHDFAKHYQKDHLKAMESCMRECDGMIVSTQFLADKYERVMRDRPIWVCENGLDTGRYRLTRPERGEVNGRETTTILWAGATGHQAAAMPWLGAVAEVMRRHDHVSFVSIGQDFAALLDKDFPGRTLFVPFTALETYPAAMMCGDIAIAPIGASEWFQAKSQLRAMEAALLGIPVVAAQHYAESVIDGVTGLLVQSHLQVAGSIAALIESDEARAQMGERARQHALDNFTMDHRVDKWRVALDEAVGSQS